MLVDQNKLKQVVDDTTRRLAADADLGHVRPRVITRLTGDASAVSAFTQYDKQFEFRCDEAESRGGEGADPSPLRYFLSGLAFCQQVWYAKASALVGCTLEDLEIELTTYMDMRGEHKVAGQPNYPQWVLITSTVASASSTDLVLQMVQEANDRCPVYGLVNRAIPIYDRIWHNGELVKDTAPSEIED